MYQKIVGKRNCAVTLCFRGSAVHVSVLL